MRCANVDSRSLDRRLKIGSATCRPVRAPPPCLSTAAASILPHVIRNALPLLAAAALSVWARPNPYPAVRQAGNYMHNYYIPPAPGSTPWAPCWSPDGKWIAVAMQGSIWKVDPRTGGAEELTYGTTYHSSPAWSPD